MDTGLFEAGPQAGRQPEAADWAVRVEMARELMRDTSHLPASLAEQVQSHAPRARADAIGARGLPDRRYDLDELVVRYVAWLIAEPDIVRGRDVAAELGLPGTRAVRALTAYARVHHRIADLVGLPGAGYCWAHNVPRSRDRAARAARRNGLDDLFLAALYEGRRPGAAIGQMALRFTGSLPAEVDEDTGEAVAYATVAAADHGETLTAMLVDLVSELRQHEAGRRALAVAGEAHRDVLVPVETLEDLEGQLAGMLAHVRQARGGVPLQPAP